MPGFTNFASPAALKAAAACFQQTGFYNLPRTGNAADWRRALFGGKAAWDCSNVAEVDRTVNRMVSERADAKAIAVSIQRRRDWTAEVLHYLRASDCVVDIKDGVANISYARDAPACVTALVEQHGLDKIACIFRAIVELENERVGGIPVFSANVSTIGWRKHPCIHKDVFVVGRPDVDTHDGTWTHVHPTIVKARNHAKRLERKREDFDLKLIAKEAENGRKSEWRKEQESIAKAKQEDEDVLMEAFGG